MKPVIRSETERLTGLVFYSDLHNVTYTWWYISDVTVTLLLESPTQTYVFFIIAYQNIMSDLPYIAYCRLLSDLHVLHLYKQVPKSTFFWVFCTISFLYFSLQIQYFYSQLDKTFSFLMIIMYFKTIWSGDPTAKLAYLNLVYYKYSRSNVCTGICYRYNVTGREMGGGFPLSTGSSWKSIFWAPRRCQDRPFWAAFDGCYFAWLKCTLLASESICYTAAIGSAPLAILLYIHSASCC